MGLPVSPSVTASSNTATGASGARKVVVVRRRLAVRRSALKKKTCTTGSEKLVGIARANKRKEARSTAIVEPCPICREDSRHPVVLAPCGHVACGSCVLDWFNYQRSCPICREPVIAVAHSTSLENRLRFGSRSSSSSAKPALDDSIDDREELGKRLRALIGQDLNNIPGDYRKYVLSAISHRAGRKQNIDVLKAFLTRLGSRASTNLTCRIAASWRLNSKEAFELLIEHGARINGNSYNRPIHIAVRANNMDALKALLALDADPLRAEQGDVLQSAFHLAARLGRPQALRCLLENVLKRTYKNADGVLVSPFVPLPRDSKGRTPMEVCHLSLTKHRGGMTCSSPAACNRCLQRQSCCKGLYTFCDALTNILDGMQRVSPQPTLANDTESEASSSADDGEHFFDESDIDSEDDDMAQPSLPHSVRNAAPAHAQQHRDGLFASTVAAIGRGMSSFASMLGRSRTRSTGCRIGEI